MLKEQAAKAGAERQAPSSMSTRSRILIALAWIAGLAAAYLVLAMFTQAMLGGSSAEEIWWDRVYTWLEFLVAGWLSMTAVYLSRRARDLMGGAGIQNRSLWRLLLFPMGHALLAGCLYFADFATYLVDQGRSARSLSYQALAVGFVAAAAIVFWYARKLGK